MVDLFLRSTVILLIANESKWNRQGVTECQCVMHTRETSFLGLHYQMVFAVNMNIILNMKAMFAVMNTSKAEVKILIQACMGFESMAFAIPVQCSTNWANKATGS